MCRAVAYLGRPVSLASLLYETDSSLIHQSYSPRMMNTFLNLAGFGMAVWDPHSATPSDPFVYRSTTLPSFDHNLRNLAAKLRPASALAHVRGVTNSEDVTVADTNLHPFRFPGTQVAMAHNGHLREFAQMRFDLVEFVRPDLARHISGTTDSEWLCAVVLSQLEDPFGEPSAQELGDAVAKALRIVRQLRRGQGIDVSSPVNLFFATRDALLVTRFSFDYGWYPAEDEMLETDLPYCSLWFTFGGEYALDGAAAAMTAAERVPGALLIASEPLTIDRSTWLEMPEYSMLAATLTDAGVDIETLDLDA